MNTQPEATTEQLANSLEFDVFISVKILRQAAALLRTQHADIERKDALLLLALEALSDAATSLETIELRSFGEESCLSTMPQVRGYAGNRAKVARAALKEQP